jgi:hypothetical protein
LKVEPTVTIPVNAVQRAILDLFEVERVREASDPDLLQRFAQSRDEVAFRRQLPASMRPCNAQQ